MSNSIPYTPDMDAGRGYNLLDGDALPNPAVTGTLKTVQASGGQQVTSRIIRVESSTSLSESLGVSVSGSGGYAGLKVSAKVDFAESSQFNEYSKFLLVQVTVRNATLTFDNPVLTEDAADLIRTNQPERFRQRFGDVFLSGIERGGEFFAVYEISGSDEKEKESLAIAVEASFNYGLASAELDTKINSAKEKSTSSLDVKTHVFQQGAVDTTVQNVDEIMARAKTFPPSVAGDLAYAYAMLTEEYTTLKLPSDSFSAIDIANQREVLADYAQKRLETLTLRNNVHYILKQPDAFDGADVAQLQQWLTEITTAINTMEKQAVACSKDATKCDFTAFDSGAYLLPPLKKAEELPPTIPFPIVVGMDWLQAKKICGDSGLRFDDARSEDGFTMGGPGMTDQNGNQIPYCTLEELQVSGVFWNEAPGHPGAPISPAETWNRADAFWMIADMKPGVWPK